MDKAYIASVYQKESDEVYVETSNFEKDIPDYIEVFLQHETKDKSGITSYLNVDSIRVDRQYMTIEDQFIVVFKNPTQKINLWIEIKYFKDSELIKSKRVFVGVPETPQVTMDLPNNELFEIDIEDDYFSELTGGGGPNTLPENEIILSEDIINHVREYVFDEKDIEQDFSKLEYLGGGGRLLIDRSTNRFKKQEENQKPWEMDSFLFLESNGQNKVPFDVSKWEVSGEGLFQSVLTKDIKLSQEFDVLKVKCRQNNRKFKHNDVTLKPVDKFNPIYEDTDYTFSAFFQVKPITKTTKVERVTLIAEWFDGDKTYINKSFHYFSTRDFNSMTTLAGSFKSPAGARFVNILIQVGSLDFGDEFEVYLFAPQLEQGNLNTSRMYATRLEDLLLVKEVNLEHFKLRLQTVMGHSSNVNTFIQLVKGFIGVGVSKNKLHITVGEPQDSFYTEMITNFEFKEFEKLDFVIEVKSEDFIKLYRDGKFIAQKETPEYWTFEDTLKVCGSGMELSKLSVFTWSYNE